MKSLLFSTLIILLYVPEITYAAISKQSPHRKPEKSLYFSLPLLSYLKPTVG